MNTRLSRKGVDFGESRNNEIFGIFDSIIKDSCRISEDELDLLCDIATDDELALTMSNELSFGEKRLLIKFLNEKIYNKL